ncbi:hypothetical protein [Acinetobacter entericus]|uniref:Uncharacterized protein n=1 Tax=Acinetobacter entericus TaxID=2989714 RepID=A0ABT3NF97_9GAMM|nr:hypothetical protein [Acinetobacter entericus]MCW8037949.1 hypothetical protein [Acinetobacter entericus]
MTNLAIHKIRRFSGLQPKYIKLAGNGYLGGDYPDAVTRIKGVPAKTEIMIFLHRKRGEAGDGKLIARIDTEVSGSWRVGNLNPDLRYDVICRQGEYKAEIMSNIQPKVE